MANYGTPVYGEPPTLSGIDVHEAAGTWSFEDTVIATAYRVVITGAAFYEDRYQWGDDGAWRIRHTG